MNVSLAHLSDWVRADVANCENCSVRDDGTAFVCGWHENLAAAARVIDRLPRPKENPE